MRRGNAFGRVCLCVCFVWTLTFEGFDLQTSFLVRRYIFRISRKISYIKVIGPMSRSQEQKVKIQTSHHVGVLPRCVLLDLSLNLQHYGNEDFLSNAVKIYVLKSAATIYRLHAGIKATQSSTADSAAKLKAISCSSHRSSRVTRRFADVTSRQSNTVWAQ